MKYIEVSFTMDDTGLWRDMLVDTLGNEGPYESFVETPDGLKAYVQASQYDAAWLASAVQAFPVPLRYKAEEMEDRDWNAEWEKGHEAVLVQYGDHDRKVVNAAAQYEAVRSGSIWVRAPFHPHRDDVSYELIIEPKMSFGTAHHPTTYMMLSYVAELPVNGLRVLDMGCGTAVLGILAKMRGASYVEGIDIDEWAFANARENAASNGVELTFKLGGAEAIDGSFDIILANINRNILLADMAAYVACMAPGAQIFMSGFYEDDVEVLRRRAGELGLRWVRTRSRDRWACVVFEKC